MLSVEEKELIAVLDAFINEKEITLPADMDWNKLVYLAKIHAVMPILYHMKKKSGCSIEEKLEEYLFLAYSGNVSGAIRKEYEIEQVIARFNQEKILHVPLKGYQLKNYYPIPEMRTMGDVDILVPEGERKRVDRILLEMGFEKTHDLGFVWNYRKSNTEIEVHVKLAEPGLWKGVNCEAYFDDALSHIVGEDDSCTKYLEPEYNFIFLMYHLAKHFYGMGAGLRMFLDIAVYLQKFDSQMDWGYIERELENLHLTRFTKIVFALCNKWFGTESRFEAVNLEEDLYEEVSHYIISGGVFGHTNREVGIFRIRRSMGQEELESGGRKMQVKAFLKWLFPSRTEMRKYLPMVEKYWILLPAAGVIRIYGGLFKRRTAIKHTLKGFAVDTDKVKQQEDFLRKVGL